jgi:gliding motility-associated-like protein
MRYAVAIIFMVLLLKAQVAFAQVKCFTPQEEQLYQDNGFIGYRYLDIRLPIPTYGPKLPAYNTAYQFVSGTPAAGQYTIIRDTRGMNPDKWFQIDTRTDPNDGTYMLVMNASNVKTDFFYEANLGPFCPKTTYKVTVWIYNLYKNNGGIKPNLTFKISTLQGASRVTYNTGDVANNDTWITYDMVFTTPNVKEDLKITMINNNAGGEGNAFAMDNVVLGGYGPTINPVLDGNNSRSIAVCSGMSYAFPMHATFENNYAHPMYQWQVKYPGNGNYVDIPGETTTAYTANYASTEIGTINYRLSVAEGDNINCSDCRAYSVPITITINNLPITGAQDVAVCEGEELQLNPTAVNIKNQTYEWTGPGGFISFNPNPIISNSALTDAGTYHVVIKNAVLCTIAADVKVKVNPRVTATVSSNVTICQGSNTVLHASGGEKYNWSPATGLDDPTKANPVATPNITTVYTVLVSNVTGCSATGSVKVSVVEPPGVNAGADETITEGDKLQLKGKVTGDNVSYYWTPADYLSSSTELNPKAYPTGDITYTLHARDNNGCNFEVTDEVFIRVYKKVSVPNSFSPNNDGINDTWSIPSLAAYPKCTVQVFNRYGQAVFASEGYPKAWDGKINAKQVNEGTYYYKIDLKNGKILSGWVAIIR